MHAWDLYLRGMSCLHNFSKEGNAQAREMFEQALSVDQTYSRGWTGLAYSYYRDAYFGFADDHAQAISNCLSAAQRAVSLDDTDSFTHFVFSRALHHAGKIEQAIREARLAIELNPNDSGGHASLGALLAFNGDPDAGIVELRRALQLSPKDPRGHIYLSIQSGGHFVAERYEDAALLAREALARQPGDTSATAILAASLVLGDHVDDASGVLNAGPRIDASRLERLSVVQWFNSADRERFKDALKRAGWRG